MTREIIVKVSIILASALLISSCDSGPVYENDLKTMISFCEDKGGLTYFLGSSNYSVRCNSGEKAYKLDLIKE